MSLKSIERNIETKRGIFKNLDWSTWLVIVLGFISGSATTIPLGEKTSQLVYPLLILVSMTLVPGILQEIAVSKWIDGRFGPKIEIVFKVLCAAVLVCFSALCVSTGFLLTVIWVLTTFRPKGPIIGPIVVGGATFSAAVGSIFVFIKVLTRPRQVYLKVTARLGRLSIIILGVILLFVFAGIVQLVLRLMSMSGS